MTKRILLSLLLAAPLLVHAQLTCATGGTWRAGQYFNDGIRPGGGTPPYSCTITGSLPSSVVQGGKSGCGFVSGALGTTQGNYSATFSLSDSSSTPLTKTCPYIWTITAANPPVPLSAFQGVSLGTNGAFNGVIPRPDDAWHQPIDHAEVDAISNNMMAVNATGYKAYHIHPNWGTQYGLPYTVVDSALQNIPFVLPTFAGYDNQSDHSAYPLTQQQAIEDGSPTCPYDPDSDLDGSDHHASVFDRATGVASELWHAGLCKGRWTSVNGAIWDFTRTQQRPYGETSVDAAGLSVIEGLLTYDDAANNTITGAIRYTGKFTQRGVFVAPATHSGGNTGAASDALGTNPVTGMRLRLKASFDVSSYSAVNQNILRAMKKWGMILADNGSSIYVIGTLDPRWDDVDLQHLTAVGPNDLEVVALGAVLTAATAPQTPIPTITSFTASATFALPNQPVTLTINTTNAVTVFNSCTGLMRGNTATFIPQPGTTPCTAYASGLTAPDLSADVYYVTSAPLTITVPPIVFQGATVSGLK